MWKSIRIVLLLLVLLAVALQAWLDRVATHSWQEPIWVGLFPLNGDARASTGGYLGTLRGGDFAAIEDFFSREAKRYGLKLGQPVHVELYPAGATLPPTLAPDAGPLGIAWWSLKLRWFASRATAVPGRAPPRVRLFLLYHDAALNERAPDSHGLEKGLVGVVHLFADPGMSGPNDIVIAHELLHTVGASDKYDLRTGAPLFPRGYGNPAQQPLYPQEKAEVMAGRRALSPSQSDMPRTLADVVIGPETALEIRWTH